ncbi:hypothetical protein ASZ90_020214 [hydrocarbon metagenome]|uniref:Uncharacterized protein n=1 Tax=hydrocarbon metagenome TaxID=938273 RepID=A0A0W8E160_9ZZZZ
MELYSVSYSRKNWSSDSAIQVILDDSKVTQGNAQKIQSEQVHGLRSSLEMGLLMKEHLDKHNHLQSIAKIRSWKEEPAFALEHEGGKQHGK